MERLLDDLKTIGIGAAIVLAIVAVDQVLQRWSEVVKVLQVPER